MTCREFATFIADYLAGEVAADTRRAFDQHLEVCENCRRYLASYRETVTLGKRAFDDECAPVPAEVPEELVRAVLKARQIS